MHSNIYSRFNTFIYSVTRSEKFRIFFCYLFKSITSFIMHSMQTFIEVVLYSNSMVCYINTLMNAKQGGFGG